MVPNLGVPCSNHGRGAINSRTYSQRLLAVFFLPGFCPGYFTVCGVVFSVEPMSAVPESGHSINHKVFETTVRFRPLADVVLQSPHIFTFESAVQRTLSSTRLVHRHLFHRTVESSAKEITIFPDRPLRHVRNIACYL